MNPEDENLRIFLGLPIEAQDGDELKARFLSAPQTLEGVSWVDPRNYHLTIRFLGQFPKAAIPPLIKALGKLTLPKPTLSALQIAAFPKTGGYGIAANLRLSTELAKLFHLVSRLCDSFGFQFESHSFRPHITLAKMKKNQKNLLLEKVPLKNHDLKVDELVLYQSILDASGSHYIPLHRFKLTGTSV